MGIWTKKKKKRNKITLAETLVVPYPYAICCSKLRKNILKLSCLSQQTLCLWVNLILLLSCREDLSLKPRFPLYWHVFCKTLKLHNGRRAGNCCQMYEVVTVTGSWPEALVLCTTRALQMEAVWWLHLGPGGEMQIYRRGQDAGELFLWQQQVGCQFASVCIGAAKGKVWTGAGGPVARCLAQNAESGDTGPGFNTPERAFWNQASLGH